MKKIVIIAGDLSGDLYGGLLSKKIKEKFSNVEIFSLGGINLARHTKQIFCLTDYAVSGIFEVTSSLYKLYSIFKDTVAYINKIKPDLVIPVDFPDFNLRLIKKLNKKFPVFYYVSPQVWAWRKNRLKLIKKYIDTMVVIFKFEEEFYRSQNVNVKYFGHPLLELVTKTNMKPKKIISFMPGSRKNEIKLNLPIIEKTKIILEKKLPDYSFRIICPQNIPKNFYKKFSTMDVTNHSYQAMEESTFIITSSGTATVEIALLEVPFIIFYKLRSPTWYILKRLVNTKFIGMVNILAGRKIIEEFLQNDAKPLNLANKTIEIINDNFMYNKIKNELSKIKDIISPSGATENFASFIGEYLRL
ncbi:MAG: lipid-A-disaccharide synthase [Candidatus Omnitrophica bacterium]|nr:lipid-A-disaccharide synthase [Candidatus Omnitrophota bacterium]